MKKLPTPPFLLSFFLIFASSCSYRPTTEAYRSFYSHLENQHNSHTLHTLHSSHSFPSPSPSPLPLTFRPSSIPHTDCFIVFLVDARHLDYTEGSSLLKTIVKHPSDGSKNGDVGHAWIYLQGIVEGQKIFIEGGHSGELGLRQAKYFDGIMNNIEYGYANPSEAQKRCPRYESNPIKYLWATQCDGYFQRGSGGHTPTCAVKIDLTVEQFEKILSFIDPDNYVYEEYSLTGNQCTTFIAKIADLIDFPMEYEVSIRIPPQLKIGGETFTLWTDPQYASFTFSSPDIAEHSLILALNSGIGENALLWYKSTHRKCWHQRWSEAWENVRNFPYRFQRSIQF